MTITAQQAWLEPAPSARADRRVDWMVLGTLAMLMALCMALATQVENYGRDTTTYLLLARSILTDGSYTFNFEPHTVYPPGYPIILAALMALGIENFTGLVRATIPIFFAGVGAVYWLLRAFDRRAAIVAALLTATSFTSFFWITAGLHSEIPYFACSLAALLCIHVSGRAQRPWQRLLAIAIGSLLVAFLPLLRTMGVTLAAGLGLWIVQPALWFWRSSAESTLTRLKRWGPAVALTLLVVAGWMQWGSRNDSGYEGEGFMSSYPQQLMKSDPHDLSSPAIGAADLPVRVIRMAAVRAQRMAETMLNQPYAGLSPVNPLTLAVVVLVTVGFLRSFSTSPTAFDCYFLAYMSLLVLWPFDEGNRFLLPVLPFLYFYAIEGIRAVAKPLRRRIRADRPGALKFAQRALAATALIVILGGAVYHSAVVAYDYRTVDPTTFRIYPTVVAADWIRQNTPADAVIVDENYAVMHRLTGRRTYRFPLITEAGRINEIIAGTDSDFVVVLDERPHEYFSPSVEQRWEAARAAAPNMYSLVHEFEFGRIYRMVAGLDPTAAASPASGESERTAENP